MTDTTKNLKPFVKGDPRINRKGRPKSFDAVRELAQAIAHEVALSKNEPIVINGKIATVEEMILRQWANSGNFQKQQAFLWYCHGKIPDELDVKSAGEKIQVIGVGINTDKI